MSSCPTSLADAEGEGSGIAGDSFGYPLEQIYIEGTAYSVAGLIF